MRMGNFPLIFAAAWCEQQCWFPKDRFRVLFRLVQKYLKGSFILERKRKWFFSFIFVAAAVALM